MTNAWLRPLLKRLMAPNQVMFVQKMEALYFTPYFRRSYSQEGEDMILRRVFEGQTAGFYVDVGAHHPKHLSNTYAFYRQGWRGLNIDAMPGSMRVFRQLRPRDISVECAIAADKRTVVFYIFNNPSLNTCDEVLARSRVHRFRRIEREVSMQARRLDDVLSHHLPKGQTIDFLNIDVEGLDLEVLQSNDWARFRPRFLIAECWDLQLEHLDQLASHPMVSFLAEHNYALYAKSYSTAFFRDRNAGDLPATPVHDDNVTP